MTIADNIDFLNDVKKLFEDIANDPKINETIKTYFIIEALENAINVMRKYQKIQEIVNSKTTRLSYEKGFRQIKEIIKDD